MNRYSQISTSQFNPLSLEEIMAAPLYKQKQYDALDADRVATQEAFKVDPDNKYLEEAQRLQNDFNAKADELARYQLKTGDLQGAKSKMLDLRKEYKRLTDPMGAVSQINNDKININKQREDTILNMTKLGFSPKAAQNYFEKQLAENRKSPLYNKQGQIDTFRPNLPNQYQDYIKTTQDFMKDTGVTSSEIKTLHDGFVNDINSGISYTEAIGKMRSNVSNKEQRDSVVAFMKDNIFDESSPVRQTMDIDGVSVDDALSKIEKMSGIYKKYTKSQEDTNNIGNVQRSEKIKEQPFQGDAYNLGEGKLFETNQKLLKELGLSSTGIEGFTKEERDQQSPFNAPLFKISSVKKSTTKSQEYKNLASSINRTLPQNQKFKEGSEQEENVVKNYLNKYGNTIIKNRVIDPFVDPTGLLFADKTIGKEAKAAQENLKKRVAIKASKMVYDDGTEVPSYLLPTFSYNGDLTAESNINVFKEDKRQNYLAHTGTVKIGKDKDAEIKTVYISRNSDDFNTPQYKGGVDKNKINNITVSQPNIYHHFKSSEIKGFSSNDMKDVEIKYNENKGSYDISYKHLKDGNVDFSLTTDETGSAETKFNKWLIKLNN